ncbi:MAG: ATP-binding protein [Elusimicrobia bacterium]|nr:ATP-binding protein [Elusimicrobiota bacterium]
MKKRPTRVLVVEGDEDLSSLVDSYLSCAPDSEENLILTHAPRLSTACHLLARQSFDALLLDLSLPQTTGLEGFHKIRALMPLLPIIILTGKKDESLAAQAVRLGAQDYFLKGSPDCFLLKRAIRYAIENKQLTNEIGELLAGGSSREKSPRPEDPGGELSAVDARNHFLGRISHEMRNTLATMKTAAYCLKEGTDDKLSEQQAQLVEMISRNIDRQTRIVENILDLSRFRSGKLNIRFQPTDAASIIADLADEYRMSRGAQMLQVRVTGDLPTISCDPDLIAQVLRNLLDNALRYAKEKIDIEASKAGPDSIAVSVTDDGSGIPEEHLAGLFTHFQRLDGPENEGAHKGTGLGLAICREIIEGHHGRIRAENAAGLGARFSFELPVRNGLEKAAGTDGRALSAAGARRPPYSGKRSYLLHK